MIKSVFVVVLGALVFVSLTAVFVAIIGRHLNRLDSLQAKRGLLDKYDFWSNASSGVAGVLAIETSVDAVWGSGSTTNYSTHLPLLIGLLILVAVFWALGTARRWHVMHMDKLIVD